MNNLGKTAITYLAGDADLLRALGHIDCLEGGAGL
jgi:hypothetical protein